MKIKPTPETIWTRPAYLPYVQSPLTDEAIRAAEQHLGVVLPAEFIAILRVQNGGPIRFRLPDSVGELIAGIGASFPSITEFDLADFRDWVDFSLEGLVPFDGDGHWYLCLDYRSDGTCPGVSYIDVECNSERVIARSFRQFLDLLELEIEDELVLANVENIDDARKRLEGLFRSPFESKMSNVGVPYLKCQAGKKWNECFWITGNKVAYGYSGDDPSAMEFEGNALLFPELSPHAVIFQASEEHLDRYRIMLRDAGLQLVDIETAWSAMRDL